MTVGDNKEEAVEVEAWHPITAARRAAKELKEKIKPALKVDGSISTTVTRVK